jgi:hypothetical protein
LGTKNRRTDWDRINAGRCNWNNPTDQSGGYGNQQRQKEGNSYPEPRRAVGERQ